MKYPMRLMLLVPFLPVFGSLSLASQVTLNSDDYAYSGDYSNKNVVRDSTGKLYCLSVSENLNGDRPLLLLSSANGGVTWQPDSTALNDATSGLVGPNPTTQCGLAIDDQDRLHLLWASYYYPSYYKQWYRQYQPSSGTLSAVVNISAITGATVGVDTGAMDLILDEQNTVWLVAHGTNAWIEELLRSTTPYASSLTFNQVGKISTSNSASRTRLCIDSAGRVHCSYYRSWGPGVYAHRYFDGMTNTWGPEVTLGDTTVPNDYNGALAADSLGNVHALVAKNSYSGSALWEFRYRRWNAQSGWGSEVFLYDATHAQQFGIANDRIVTLACNETTGEVTAVYRDLSAGGLLRTATKGLTDANFSPGVDLTAPSMGLHTYYAPTVRGTLYPAFNRTESALHVTWQYRALHGTPPYDFMFDRVDSSVGTNFCQPNPNTTGAPALMAAQGSASLSANDLVLKTSSVPSGKPGIFLMGNTAIPGFPYGDGIICIGGGAYQVFPVVYSDASGQLTSPFDNTLPIYSQMSPGSSYSFQAIFRDHVQGGSGFNLSDGLTITFWP